MKYLEKFEGIRNNKSNVSEFGTKNVRSVLAEQESPDPTSNQTSCATNITLRYEVSDIVEHDFQLSKELQILLLTNDRVKVDLSQMSTNKPPMYFGYFRL